MSSEKIQDLENNSPYLTENSFKKKTLKLKKPIYI